MVGVRRKGGGPNLEKVGPKGVGARRVEPRRVGGPKISRFFFLSPAGNFILPSLAGCLLVEFWWFFEIRDNQMCTFGLSGCHVKPRRLWGRGGFT